MTIYFVSSLKLDCKTGAKQFKQMVMVTTLAVNAYAIKSTEKVLKQTTKFPHRKRIWRIVVRSLVMD